VLGDPILSALAREVTTEDILNDSWIHDGIEAGHIILSDFRQKHGYGRAIAAPQFGYSIQMICLNMGTGTPMTLFNPSIIERSKEVFLMWDDCLSFPHLMACVQRHVSISIRFQDEQGVTRTWNNLPKDISELLQHEIDHLHGVLAVDIATKPPRCHERECQSIIPRSDWLQNKEKYEQWL
jgi:peptide deformylase